jgi:hypothetical protein
MKSFWDITPYSPFAVNQHFGGTCGLRLEGRRINQERNQREAGSKLVSWLILRSWTWRRYVPPKSRLTFNGLHCIIAQKTEPFITTVVRASILTFRIYLCHFLWLGLNLLQQTSSFQGMCSVYEYASILHAEAAGFRNNFHARCKRRTQMLTTHKVIKNILSK